MAEAHFLKKRQSIPVKRFESDDFLIKSSKSRSKRPYVHKATFKTKDQLREEIRVLEELRVCCYLILLNLLSEV